MPGANHHLDYLVGCILCPTLPLFVDLFSLKVLWSRDSLSIFIYNTLPIWGTTTVLQKNQNERMRKGSRLLEMTILLIALQHPFICRVLANVFCCTKNESSVLLLSIM